ncbi:MAG: hypothetical protein GC180_04055 [Bacteroidetes bacterium]|nr:hypothetical protein [Bacteroidota bacterium]
MTLSSSWQTLSAQVDTNWIQTPDTSQIYKVTCFDNHYFIGHIVRIDQREIEMILPVRGILILPSYTVKSIIKISPEELDNHGNLKADNTDLHLYALNTNAFGLKSGQVVSGLGLIGPDVSVGISRHLQFRLRSTWIATPMMATLNYSVAFSDKVHAQLGAMIGWGTWNYPEGGIILPYAGVTFGSNHNHLTLTGGYGQLFTYANRNFPLPYIGLSSSRQVGRNLSLIFDSYFSIYTGVNIYSTDFNSFSRRYTEANGMAMLALRYHPNGRDFVQIGGGVFTIQGDPLPLPILQYQHRFN